MAKTITFSNIKIREFSITKQEGKLKISLVYSLVDDKDGDWMAKRIDLDEDDLTKIQSKKIEDTLNTLITKVKQIEKI